MKLFIEYDFINWNEYIDIERNGGYENGCKIKIKKNGK